MAEKPQCNEPHEPEDDNAQDGTADDELLDDLTPEQRERLRQSLQNISKNLMPKVGIPKFAMPNINLKVDVAALFPALNALTQSVNKLIKPTLDILAESVTPALDRFFDQWRDQFADVAKNISRIAESAFPPNWRGGDLRFPDNLEELLLDEGLPLAWVPPRHVLDKIFAAKAAGERRRVLSNNWRVTTAACLDELKSIKEPKLREYAEFAIEAAEALQEGRWRASQALSTNLLDSILHRSFDKKSKKTLTNQKQRIDWKTYPIRSALVVGGVWGSYGEYWPSQGDPIPRKYTRHASAHGVSRRQYTRLNSLIALMHVVGVLRMIETDLLNGKK